MLESTIEKKVVAYCNQHGLVTYKFTSPNNRGVPDRIILGHSSILFLELKAPGQRPSLLQQREHRRISETGHYVLTADSYDTAVGYISTFFGL